MKYVRKTCLINVFLNTYTTTTNDNEWVKLMCFIKE